MFQSEPICILQAGTTVDGREIEQHIIDEIAESYDPNVYSARINEEHFNWSYKYGSVLSVEKRDDKLFAVIKPNSMLLRTVEQGQLLHTSCEFKEKFSDTGKAYLTGLALTDRPASLGTTEIHLSAKDDGKVRVQTNFTVSTEQFSQSTEEEASMFQKFKCWLKGEEHSEQLSQQQEEDEMSKKTEELLEKSIEQNTQLNDQLGQLVTQLSAQNKPNEEGTEVGGEQEESSEVTELKGQVTELSGQVEKLSEQLEKLSRLTDEEERNLAGSDGEEEPYL